MMLTSYNSFAPSYPHRFRFRSKSVPSCGAASGLIHRRALMYTLDEWQEDEEREREAWEREQRARLENQSKACNSTPTSKANGKSPTSPSPSASSASSSYSSPPTSPSSLSEYTRSVTPTPDSPLSSYAPTPTPSSPLLFPTSPCSTIPDGDIPGLDSESEDEHEQHEHQDTQADLPSPEFPNEILRTPPTPPVDLPHFTKVPDRPPAALRLQSPTPRRQRHTTLIPVPPIPAEPEHAPPRPPRSPARITLTLPNRHQNPNPPTAPTTAPTTAPITAPTTLPTTTTPATTAKAQARQAARTRTVPVYTTPKAISIVPPQALTAPVLTPSRHPARMQHKRSTSMTLPPKPTTAADVPLCAEPEPPATDEVTYLQCTNAVLRARIDEVNARIALVEARRARARAQAQLAKNLGDRQGAWQRYGLTIDTGKTKMAKPGVPSPVTEAEAEAEADETTVDGHAQDQGASLADEFAASRIRFSTAFTETSGGSRDSRDWYAQGYAAGYAYETPEDEQARNTNQRNRRSSVPLSAVGGRYKTNDLPLPMPMPMPMPGAMPVPQNPSAPLCSSPLAMSPAVSASASASVSARTSMTPLSVPSSVPPSPAAASFSSGCTFGVPRANAPRTMSEEHAAALRKLQGEHAEERARIHGAPAKR